MKRTCLDISSEETEVEISFTVANIRKKKKSSIE